MSDTQTTSLVAEVNDAAPVPPSPLWCGREREHHYKVYSSHCMVSQMKCSSTVLYCMYICMYIRYITAILHYTSTSTIHYTYALYTHKHTYSTRALTE